MPVQFRGLDERGVPRFTGGSESPELVVWAILLAGGLLFGLLMCVCAAVALAAGEYVRSALSLAAALAATVILVLGSVRWLDLGLRLPYLVTEEQAVERLGIAREGAPRPACSVGLRPRANIDGRDLYDVRDLAAPVPLLRPSGPPQDSLLRPAVPGDRGSAEVLLRPSDSDSTDRSDRSDLSDTTV